MNYVEIAIKLIIGLSIMNVWLVRANKATQYRGGTAANIKEEFQAYGLPNWFMVVIGTLKLLLSIMLIVSIWFPEVELISSLGIAVLMLGAVTMHIKIGDPLKKSLPAFIFLVLSLVVYFI